MREVVNFIIHMMTLWLINYVLGWTIHKLHFMDVQCYKYSPMRVAGGNTSIGYLQPQYDIR